MMAVAPWACARCAQENHRSSRFCGGCGLPLGSAEADAEAGFAALGPYEAPEPADPDVLSIVRDLALRSGYAIDPSGHGWRLIVPLEPDRRQAVYVGLAGTDAEGRALLNFVSVCGPATDRDARILLKLNARIVDGHFAIRTLLGEDYFVVLRNVHAATAHQLDAPGLVRSIAEMADGLEDRLSRGRDLY